MHEGHEHVTEHGTLTPTSDTLVTAVEREKEGVNAETDPVATRKRAAEQKRIVEDFVWVC